MERESQESKTVVDLVVSQASATKPVSSSLSVIDSLFRQMRMVDSLINPAMARLLAGMTLSIPKATIADGIRSQLQVFDAIDRQVTKVLASSGWVAQFAQISAQFRATINRLSLLINSELSTALLPLKELAERIGTASNVRDAFRHYNLWLAPSMSEELVGKIVSLYEAYAGSGTVHSVVSRYYAKDNWYQLDEIFERCRNNSLFKSRMKLIEEALIAHREGLYILSVTGLLVHLEGIAADYVKKHKLLPQLGGKTREIILTALNDTPYSLLDIRTYAGVSALIAYVEDSMFASVNFDKDHVRLRGENRLMGHAVRHGRQVAFGSRMNSLRLILFIDAMTLLED